MNTIDHLKEGLPKPNDFVPLREVENVQFNLALNQETSVFLTHDDD